jgi:putative spermidine/putrescine transport system permease protein
MMRRAGWRVLVGLCWAVLLFLMLPTLVAVPVSLTTHRYLSLPDDGVTLAHYAALLTDPSWRNAILQSLGIGVASTLLALALGGLAAIGLWRLASALAEAARIFALAPLIVPPVVTALALYRAFAQIGLLDNIVGVVIGHALLATPYVLVATATSLSGIDRRQEQASRSLGATGAQTVRHVILPQAMPGLAAGAVFAFLTSWDEIIVTLFLASRAVYTLPRRMWDGINENVDPTIAAAATVLFVVTFVLIGARALRGGTREPAA